MEYTLGEFLRTTREEKNMSLREFSAALGISHTYLDSLEKGFNARTKKEVRPSAATCSKLAEKLNISINKALFMAGFSAGETKWDEESETSITEYYPPHSNSLMIPVLGRVPAGTPIDAVEDITGWEEISFKTFSNAHTYFALLVVGDSMTPKYLDGDIVIVQVSDDADSGKDVVAVINGSDATLKKLIKYESGSITLQPSNPAYHPMHFSIEEVETKPVKILGFVKELRRKI